jgi:nucleoside-diphosphate-sugar epimerase
MKRILITGKNSYVGSNLEQWLENYPGSFSTDTISLRKDIWKDKNFSEYDVIIHVAGIAHIKETKENAHLYYEVNRDLAYEVAKKAKSEGVKQFIFLSSMSVYGLETGVISEKTPLKPKSNYGRSKLQAEELLKTLECNFFKLVIIRPPMIYGKDCKGNYLKLVKISKTITFFPDIENKRSMIYIDNLCELIRLIIKDSNSGLFLPQNAEYVCTSKLVKKIAELHGSKMRMTKLFNFFLKLIRINLVKKVFGDLLYDNKIDEYKNKYVVYDFETSIKLTEK